MLAAPVATGKSRVAYTVAKWREACDDRGQQSKGATGQPPPHGAAVLTPNNLLVKQYTDEFPDLPTLARKASYWCSRDRRRCEETQKRTKSFCSDCTYICARHAFTTAPSYVANYYTYLAHKSWRRTLVVDEAHNLLRMLLDDAATHVWRPQHEYPRDLQSYTEVLGWLEQQGDARLKKLLRTLRRDRQRSLFERTSEQLRGVDTECLKFTPIDARDRPPVLWNPARVKKIVLLSATIGTEDVYDLGLDRRRVAYVTTSSPIPADRRPCLYKPVLGVNVNTTDDDLSKLANEIRYIADAHSGEKGVIHTTYALAQRLRPLLDNSRFLWHTSQNRESQYRAFRQRRDACVLVACGMGEGIDLAGDAGRWQVITKVPYLNLGDPAVAHKAAERPKWYQWQAVTAVLQTYGRICRTPQDDGVTYLLDKSFESLYSRNREMFPNWFSEALEFV